MTSYLQNLLSDEIIQSISYTLLHSLWQAPLVALLMFIALKRFDQKKSGLRYNIAMASLLLVCFTALFTFLYYYLRSIGLSPEGSIAHSPNQIEASYALSTVTLTDERNMSVLQLIEANFTRITYSWIIGVLLFSLRIVFGQWHLKSIKSSLNFELSIEYQAIIDKITNRLGMNKIVRIATSQMIQVPMVMGRIKPIIVLPIAAINHLSMDEAETILAHELGHVFRNDFVQNIFIMLVESLFFFNPAIWWICNIVREERENSCDDLTVKLYPNRISYARTLVKLQEMQNIQPPHLALSLFKDKKTLLLRIKRILNQSNQPSYTKERSIATAMLLIGIISITTANGFINNNNWDSPNSIEMKPIELLENNIVHLDYKTLNVPSNSYITFNSTVKYDDVDNGVSNSKINTEVYFLKEPSNNSNILVTSDTDVQKIHNKIVEVPNIISLKNEVIYHVQLDTIDEEEIQLQKERLEKKSEEFRKKSEELHEVHERKQKEFEAQIAKWTNTWKKDHSAKMKAIEKEMEKFGEEFSKNFDSKEWEKFGEELGRKFDSKKWEKLGSEFSEKFDSEEWQKLTEEISSSVEDSFDEEWHEKMALMGEKLRIDVENSFDEQWLEEISEMGTELAEKITSSMQEMDFDFNFDHNNEFHYEHNSHHADFKQFLAEELSNDGLWNKKKNEFKITNDYLKVNGIKLDNQLYNKYKDLISNHIDDAFETETEIIFKMNSTDLSDSNKTSLSISISDN